MVKNSRFALQINWWNFIWCEHCSLRIYWRLSTILKASNKIVCSNVLWYTKVYIYWKFIQCKTQWDKTQMLKKFPSDKLHVTKNPLFFLSINQSIIYYLFSKEKTIINKYNEIKLNKTNKTLRNNLAYYLFWEKGLRKAKKPYHQALCFQGGLPRHPRQRTL